MILSSGSVLEIPELGDTHTPDSGTLTAVEKAHILRVLKECNGVVGGPKGAASRLGINRTTLQSRMKKLGIAH